MAQNSFQKKAQMAHITNLISIASLDGNIDDHEKALLFNIADGLGLTDEEFNQCLDYFKEGRNQALCVVPETDEEKTNFLKNLTTMMMIDGEIDDNEREYVKWMAERFGYDGEKALGILIDSVYQDFKNLTESNTATQAESNEGMSEEQFQREIRDLTAHGKEALEQHNIADAFDFLLLPAHVDAEAKRLFLMVLNTRTRLFSLTEEQVAMMKEYAEKGYVVSQYAYGRYLEAHRPDENWLAEATQYFQAAEKAGLGDALYCQAILRKAGHYGLVDRGVVEQMVDKALDNDSLLAARYVLNGYIYGRYDVEADPQRAINLLKQWLNGNESDDISVVNPMYYELLANAYAELGDKQNAEKYYKKAIGMGFIEAYNDYYNFLFSQDDEERFDVLEAGCEAGDPDCFVSAAAILMDSYDADHPDSGVTGDIMHNLITACEGGCDWAPYYMGDAYYNGDYGFKQDYKQAWSCFTEGADRDDGSSYKMLAYMIAQDHNPYEVSEGELEYYVMMSLRNGCDDYIEYVVEAYRDGDLTDYAAEIEQYYIPKYERLQAEGEDDDEDYDDESDSDEDEYKLIAVVKTDGKADIIEFDVEEGWDEMPEFVGAKRLDAIRTQPLYDISKQMGFDGHVTAWVDNMGLMKELPMNPVGCKLYPGPIAGDMILTMEDAKYKPMSFTSVDDLKKVVAALGAQLDHVYLDDAPDDDGRYDAWS